ncbi:hypothetical protein [Syntrophomonas palmitatica]|uniref:hypothetical protein n=1 Tax=Syntrophomonas palmitatica TaxID=402877 RepID=UPI000A7B4C63|nr:hypothetical protein [Syntrophomonas palmitatica]
MKQSKYYENIGDALKGDDAVRAYRAAQNHLEIKSPTFLSDFKRIQTKLINALELE